jgi:hypothetical protein
VADDTLRDDEPLDPIELAIVRALAPVIASRIREKLEREREEREQSSLPRAVGELLNERSKPRAGPSSTMKTSKTRLKIEGLRPAPVWPRSGPGPASVWGESK